MESSSDVYAPTFSTREHSLCQICQFTFSEFAQADQPSSLLHDTVSVSYSHHQTPEALEAAISQGCRVCSALPRVLEGFWEEKNRKGFRNMKCFFTAFPNLTRRTAGFSWEDVDGKWRFDNMRFRSDHWEDLSPIDQTYRVANHTGSSKALTILCDWFSDCRRNHPQCGQGNDSTWTPKRLLDISESTIHLRVRTEEQPKVPLEYASLSHCWGPRGVANKLLRSNLADKSSSIAYYSLPKTFQDAITISRCCGIQYLWIDALCIIQDSEEDWEQEALAMNNVYRYSVLNICASDSTDGNGGCFKTRSAAQINPAIFTYEKPGSRGHRYLIRELIQENEFLFPLDKCPLYHRGWVMQEIRLSRKLLHCRNDGLLWECQTRVASETSPSGFPNVSMRATLKNTLHSDPENHQLSTGAEMEMWADLVEKYSKCSLSYSSDKMIAIAGLVALLQPKFGDYLAGHWRKFFPICLCWQIAVQKSGTSFLAYKAPSWSWISIDGGVEYRLVRPNHPNELDCQVEVLNALVMGDGRMVSDGFVLLRGRLLVASLSGKVEGSQYSWNITISSGVLSSISISASCLDEKHDMRIDDLNILTPQELNISILPLYWSHPYSTYLCLLLRKNAKTDRYQRIGFGYIGELMESQENFETFERIYQVKGNSDVIIL